MNRKIRCYIQNWNCVATDLIDNLDKFGFERVERPIDADKIVIWNDVMSDQIMLIEYAKKKGIPTIVLQHGSKGTSRYYFPFNQPVLADKICVWGQAMKDRLLETGTPEKKIEITGTPLIKHLKPRIEHKEINVVFSPEHWSEEVKENVDTAKELLKLKGVNIFTKIVQEHNLDNYQNPIISDRHSKEHIGIVADLLSKTDLVVGIMEGTFELFAQCLDIPVVIMTDWKPKVISGDDRYLKYDKRLTNAVKQTSLKNLNKTIWQQIKNPNQLKEERKKAVIDEGGINIENPLEEIIKVIKNA